jgi:hypothetical protein
MEQPLIPAVGLRRCIALWRHLNPATVFLALAAFRRGCPALSPQATAGLGSDRYGPVPRFALVSVPVIILEPVKPVAACLAATGQIAGRVLTLVIGELLNLCWSSVHSVSREARLMKIPVFAWAYIIFRQPRRG